MVIKTVIDDVSPEARLFLAQNLPCGPHEEITYANVDRIRRDIRTECRGGIDWAREHVVGPSEYMEIAGVNCLEINPANGLKHPEVLILYFFGGGFVTGSAEEDLPVSASIASGLGVRVLSPCYALAPENPYPSAIEQAVQVYHALHQQSEFQHIVLVGESAGGNLALQVVFHVLENGLFPPAACALLSPWVDLTHSGDSESFNDGRDPTLLRAWVQNAAGLYVDNENLHSPSVSPLFRTYPEKFPPTLITTGTRDLLMSQCVRLARRMRSAGISAELRIWEEMWHVFEWYPQIPEAHRSLADICAFISARIDQYSSSAR